MAEIVSEKTKIYEKMATNEVEDSDVPSEADDNTMDVDEAQEQLKSAEMLDHDC